MCCEEVGGSEGEGGVDLVDWLRGEYDLGDCVVYVCVVGGVGVYVLFFLWLIDGLW